MAFKLCGRDEQKLRHDIVKTETGDFEQFFETGVICDYINLNEE